MLVRSICWLFVGLIYLDILSFNGSRTFQSFHEILLSYQDTASDAREKKHIHAIFLMIKAFTE